jgi:hypothetical protein
MVKGKMDKGIKIVKNFYFPRSTNKKVRFGVITIAVIYL